MPYIIEATSLGHTESRCVARSWRDACAEAVDLIERRLAYIETILRNGKDSPNLKNARHELRRSLAFYGADKLPRAVLPGGMQATRANPWELIISRTTPKRRV